MMLMNRVFKIILKCIFIFFSLSTKDFYKCITMPKKKYVCTMWKKCYIEKRSSFIYESVFLGNNVYIGPDATFICLLANIYW